jgi:hypothetical protein
MVAAGIGVSVVAGMWVVFTVDGFYATLLSSELVADRRRAG